MLFRFVSFLNLMKGRISSTQGAHRVLCEDDSPCDPCRVTVIDFPFPG